MQSSPCQDPRPSALGQALQKDLDDVKENVTAARASLQAAVDNDKALL